MIETGRAVCIDTHALIWYLSKPKRLGRGAARLLRQADTGKRAILIPAVVPIELTLLREAGRNVIGPPQVQALIGMQPAFRLAPLDLGQVMEFALLQSVGDPFDRMIIACARACSASLITADGGIHDSALVDTVWD